MKYEEYITAIAPFEDFKSRANNCSDDKFKSKFIKEADTARIDYNNRIKNLTNKFFNDNHMFIVM